MFENKFVGLIFDINCRNPDAYYERFKKFIKEYIFRDWSSYILYQTLA